MFKLHETFCACYTTRALARSSSDGSTSMQVFQYFTDDSFFTYNILQVTNNNSSGVLLLRRTVPDDITRGRSLLCLFRNVTRNGALFKPEVQEVLNLSGMTGNLYPVG